MEFRENCGRSRKRVGVGGWGKRSEIPAIGCILSIFSTTKEFFKLVFEDHCYFYSIHRSSPFDFQGKRYF